MTKFFCFNFGSSRRRRYGGSHTGGSHGVSSQCRLSANLTHTVGVLDRPPLCLTQVILVQPDTTAITDGLVVTAEVEAAGEAMVEAAAATVEAAAEAAAKSSSSQFWQVHSVDSNIPFCTIQLHSCIFASPSVSRAKRVARICCSLSCRSTAQGPQ